MKLLVVTIATILFHLSAVNAALRQSADRVRSIQDTNPWKTFQDQQGSESLIDALQKHVEELENEEATILELVEAMEKEFAAASSLGPTVPPTNFPSLVSVSTPSPTSFETPSPTSNQTFAPTASPTNQTAFPTFAPSASPTNQTAFPTISPSASPTNQTAFPTPNPSASPTVPSVPSASPSISVQPSTDPTAIPVDSPSPTLSSAPSAPPSRLPTVSVAPSNNPTLSGCGTTPEEREAVILGILDQVADSALIRDVSTPQGRATRWIISEDERVLCPNDPDIIQRWTLAVMYFSTEGNAWTECFQGDLECGTQAPFVGKVSFLSPTSECQWAGITCNAMARVTEIEYEENNLVGTIPTELGLLSQLVIWGMEQGGLTGTIPTEIGRLGNLIFIDLDFNSLSGSLPTELYNLVNLTQLDLNNNTLSGPINGLGAFTKLEFLQLHANLFTGTVPEAVGSFTRLSTFTLHETNFVGSVPTGLCNLVDTGILTSLIADCLGPTPEITCECCTDCRI